MNGGFRIVSCAGLAFLYAPIAILIFFSFNASPLITVWQGFSLDWYGAALHNPDLHRATMNSIIVAAGAAATSTGIALCAGLALHARGHAGTEALVTLPLLVPEIVMAIASLVFFAWLELDAGLINVLLAHIVFCVPFAYAPIRARLETIPPQLQEAAGDLYADGRRTFMRVTLPLLMPGVGAGALLAFITSLDDFLITQMVAPPGAQTLPVYIYSMVRRGITPEINAVSAILLAISMLVVLCSYLVNKRRLA